MFTTQRDRLVPPYHSGVALILGTPQHSLDSVLGMAVHRSTRAAPVYVRRVCTETVCS